MEIVKKNVKVKVKTIGEYVILIITHYRLMIIQIICLLKLKNLKIKTIRL